MSSPTVRNIQSVFVCVPSSTVQLAFNVSYASGNRIHTSCMRVQNGVRSGKLCSTNAAFDAN